MPIHIYGSPKRFYKIFKFVIIIIIKKRLKKKKNMSSFIPYDLDSKITDTNLYPFRFQYLQIVEPVILLQQLRFSTSFSFHYLDSLL